MSLRIWTWHLVHEVSHAYLIHPFKSHSPEPPPRTTHLHFPRALRRTLAAGCDLYFVFPSPCRCQTRHLGKYTERVGHSKLVLGYVVQNMGCLTSAACKSRAFHFPSFCTPSKARIADLIDMKGQSRARSKRSRLFRFEVCDPFFREGFRNYKHFDNFVDHFDGSCAKNFQKRDFATDFD